MAAGHKQSLIDLRFLGIGYLLIGLTGAGILAWLAIAGPPDKLTAASVIVPIETVSSATPDSTATTALPAPPKIPNGMQAAMPFDASDKRPRIAILITELGPSSATAEAAIDHLPPQVSLAFLTFSQDTADLAREAREAGHETLLDIPMEPATYPDDDPGPSALMTTASDTENTRRIAADLTMAQGYVGIVNFMGSRFTSSREKLTPVFASLHKQDLLVVDTRANALTAMPGLAQELKMPYAVADLTIDAEPSREAIDRNLAQLEQVARAKGKALGIAGAYPVTFERIAEWSKALATKGMVLAPISAIATMPKP